MRWFEENGISPTTLAFASAVFLGVVAVLIWFALPGPSASHRFTSPSGGVVLDVSEKCEEACARRIAAEFVAADGSRTRRGCTFNLTQDHPALFNAYPLWGENEQSVEIVYADAEGQGGKLALDFARDCTLAE